MSRTRGWWLNALLLVALAGLLAVLVLPSSGPLMMPAPEPVAPGGGLPAATPADPPG